ALPNGFLRMSPDGRNLAFMEANVVTLVDSAGNKRPLSGKHGNLYGLAWSPRGDEVWFTAGGKASDRALYAVSLSGRERLVYRMPGSLQIEDISSDGRVLIRHGVQRFGIKARGPGDREDRDLTLFDRSHPVSLSADGRMVLINAYGTAYLQRTDGSAAIRLADAAPQDLSRDGRTALTLALRPSPRLVLVPTGAGDSTEDTLDGIEPEAGRLFPDGRRLLVQGAMPGERSRLYVHDVKDATTRALTEGGHEIGGPVSPDGRLVLSRVPAGNLSVIDVESGALKDVPGMEPEALATSWTPDGRWIYANGRPSVPGRIYRVDHATGQKELWKELMPSDTAGGTIPIGPVPPDRAPHRLPPPAPT